MKTKQHNKKAVLADMEAKAKTITIAVYPDELAKWIVKAKAEGRSLSNWIRMQIAAGERTGESLARATERGS
jgi:hypothetical protein